MRCSRRGSMWSSGRWTCAPPGSPAPWRSSASAPTSICCKNAAPASPCLAPDPAGTPASRTPARQETTAAPAAATARPRPGGTVRRAARAAAAPAGRPGADAGPEPGRAGQHHRAVVHADRPVRHPSRGRRVRHRRRRRRPGPGRRGRPRPPHPVVRRPRCTPTAPPPPTAAHPAGTPRPAPARPAGPGHRRPGPDPPPGTRPQDWISGLRIRMTPITRGSCDHHHAEAGYRPSRKLRHLVRARNARCTAPGCGRPAATLRRGPHHRLGPRRTDLRMRPRPAMPAPPSV